MIDKSRQEILQRLDVIEKQVRAIREAIGRVEPVFPTEAEKKYAKRICLDCGKHAEIPYCPLECLSQQIESDTGYAIVSHKIDLYGYCADCQKKKTRT